MIRLRSCFTFIAYVLKESEARKERSRRDQGRTCVKRLEHRAGVLTVFR